MPCSADALSTRDDIVSRGAVEVKFRRCRHAAADAKKIDWKLVGVVIVVVNLTLLLLLVSGWWFLKRKREAEEPDIDDEELSA